MKHFILVLSLFGSLTFARDASRVGNGGGVLFCENREPILLDIYESVFNEIHTFENLNTISIDQRRTVLEDRISLFSKDYAKLLRDLRKYFYEKSHFLKVSSFKIPDDFNNLFYEATCDLKVVAVQRKPILSFDDIFFINEPLWNLSGEMTREGLIDHEVLYLISLVRGATTSKSVRKFLSFILSDSFFASSASEVEAMFYKNVFNSRWLSNASAQRKRYLINDLCKRLKKDYFFICPSFE